MSQLAREAVDLLYRAHLGRSPEAASLNNCVAHLEAGGKLGDLEVMIFASDEYRLKNTPKGGDHPLAHIAALWKPELASFFSFRGRYRPLSLTVETVNICNNDCIICPYSAQTRRKGYMTREMFDSILDQYAMIGGGTLGLTPMVGEIFLDKKLEERLASIGRHPSITAVSAISNASMASLYTDDRLSGILDRLDRLAISTYGLDRDEFRTMTRKDGYEKFRASLVRLLRIGGPEKVRISARQLVDRPQGQIDRWISEIADDAGVTPDRIVFGTTLTYANWGHFDTTTTLPHDAIWSPEPVNSGQCALPLISAQVLVDGTTSFCGCANFDGVSELNIGNVSETPLFQMLRSDRVKRLWNWEACGTPEFCKRCSFHMPIEHLSALPSAFADPLGTFGG